MNEISDVTMNTAVKKMLTETIKIIRTVKMILIATDVTNSFTLKSIADINFLRNSLNNDEKIIDILLSIIEARMQNANSLCLSIQIAQIYSLPVQQLKTAYSKSVQ